ncbi:MAG TPA: hypothetical protein VKB58_09715 [Terriglobales bacterium]|jgi:hypothetical protein|nr:hypothetical protein [Terriglobales bacterium]
MADNSLDLIVDYLRNSGSAYFPRCPEIKFARVVGHTPKPDHYIYEIVLDFADGSERVNAKIYRGRGTGRSAQELARDETQNLQFAHQTAERRKLQGVPRPIGDFSELGAVVSTKVHGLPLQSIIMKVALLPDNGNHHVLEIASRQAGQWLQQFHKATAGVPSPLDSNSLLSEMERLCAKAQKDGLPAESTDAILITAKSAFNKQRRPLRSSARLQDFVPLNVLVAEDGVGYCEFASLARQGHSLMDAATFLATVEVLEKYPFCNRDITTLVQDAFTEAYGVSSQEQALLDALKMKVLLQMFLQGRVIKESAERKKVMWTNVMKRFLQRAAMRSAARVA